ANESVSAGAGESAGKRAESARVVGRRDSQTFTISSEKMDRLMAFLGALPAASAAKLFAVLEQDRARGARDLPHEAMLSTLRARLFEDGEPFPKRAVTAQRLFFDPIEDFFIAERTGKKRRARIARSSIAPVWALIAEDPACMSAARLAAKIDEWLAANGAPDRDDFKLLMRAEAAAPADEREEMTFLGLMEGFFNAAGQGVGRIIAHAETREAYRADLIERIGGQGAYHDLVEIHTMISGASHLMAMQAAFDRPATALTEEDLYQIRTLYASAYAEAPDAAPYVLLCLMSRMEAPWRALGVFYHLDSAEEASLKDAKKDAGVIVEVLFEDLEGMVRAMEREGGADFHASQAALRIRHFTAFADGMQAEADRRRDGVIVKRIEACRDIAAETLERFAEQSAAAMRKAMPERHAGGSSRLMALRPDITRAVSPTLAREGREAAQFLADINDTARLLKRRWSSVDLLDEISTHAKRYANDLVMEIRAAEGEERAAARRLMDQTLALVAPLLAKDDVGLIRDRADAAAISA
ncbi:MAG: hypothetical protein AAFY22_07895, partial [Pseudomonadota bacterium]